MIRRFAVPVLALFAASTFAGLADAQQQQPQAGLTPSQLLAQGYALVAASSNGQVQYIYLQGVDPAGTKKIYACQLLFSPTGGFQGCLALP
jgi:hypothetical protein